MLINELFDEFIFIGQFFYVNCSTFCDCVSYKDFQVGKMLSFYRKMSFLIVSLSYN